MLQTQPPSHPTAPHPPGSRNASRAPVVNELQRRRKQAAHFKAVSCSRDGLEVNGSCLIRHMLLLLHRAALSLIIGGSIIIIIIIVVVAAEPSENGGAIVMYVKSTSLLFLR
jgi:hypothetical protein